MMLHGHTAMHERQAGKHEWGPFPHPLTKGMIPTATRSSPPHGVCERDVDHAWRQGGAQPLKTIMHTCKMCNPAHTGTPHNRQAHGCQQFESCSLRLRIRYCEAARDGAVMAESHSNRRIKQNGKLGKHNYVQRRRLTSAETNSTCWYEAVTAMYHSEKQNQASWQAWQAQTRTGKASNKQKGGARLLRGGR